MTEPGAPPDELLRRLRPIPTYRDHPATTGADVEGVAPDGDRRRVEVIGADEPVLLLFLSSSCSGCADFWTGAPALDGSLGTSASVVIVTQGPDQEDIEAIAQLSAAAPGVEVVMSSQVYRHYRVSGPPFFVLVIGTEVRTEGVAWGVSETEALVRHALEATATP